MVACPAKRWREDQRPEGVCLGYASCQPVKRKVMSEKLIVQLWGVVLSATLGYTGEPKSHIGGCNNILLVIIILILLSLLTILYYCY